MLETAYLLLFYLVALLHPQSRSLFYPWKILVSWSEEEHALALRWNTDLPILGARLRYREICNGYKSYHWTTQSSEWEMFPRYKWLMWECKNTVILRDLRPHCVYEYQVGAGLLWSPITRVVGKTPFYTSPPDDEVTRLIVMGDLGNSVYSQVTKDYLRDFLKIYRVDGILHLGDIAYNFDDIGGKVGDVYLKSLHGIADTHPYMVCPGNHEAADNFTHYKARFRMPVTPENQGSNFFYSFNMGRAHFTMLSSEVYAYNSIESVETQYNWLKDDLTKANQRRPDVPWIFTFMHKPLYCNIDYRRPLHKYKCNINCLAETWGMRSHFEELFNDIKVDVSFTAHLHRYERLRPIRGNVTVKSEMDEFNFHLNPRAPIHIVAGNAGNNHGPNDISATPQLWTVFQSAASGFGVLTVFNSTHLLWEMFDSGKRQLIDYVWVVKFS